MNATRAPIAARLTPAGRGAIAVIGVAHAPTHWNDGVPLFHAVNQRPWHEQPLQRLLYGQWGAVSSEDVVICRIDADSFEIHCHGGDTAVARILADLKGCGIDTVSSDVWQHNFADLLDSELQQALSQALTARTADLINEQLCLATTNDGITSSAPSPPSSGERVGVRGRTLDRHTDQQWAQFGLHLTRPWQVVLTGRPNVGKSSLINALLGFERAIVAEQPGTTRDVVTAITAFEGWPVQLSDTAGLRTTDSELEAAGIARAYDALRDADLRVIVLDIGEPPTATDQDLLAEWPDAIVVAHKCDRPDHWGDALPADALRVSSWTGEGLGELQCELVRRLVPTTPPPGTPIPITPRQMEWLSIQAESASERRPG